MAQPDRRHRRAARRVQAGALTGSAYCAGYWHPAHFASAAATFDQLSRGRLLVNVVTGADDVRAYGDVDLDKSSRYARTREFLQLVRRLWREEDVTFDGEYFSVEHSTLQPRTFGADEGRHPKLYFGGASAAAEEVAAEEADVQLFWGEPLDGIAERIERLEALSEKLGRETGRQAVGVAVAQCGLGRGPALG